VFGQFCASDSDALYEIRNHSTVRTFMPSPEPLPRDRHLDWVGSKLLNKDSDTPLLIVGRVNKQPVGFGVLKPTSVSGVLEVGVIVAGDWQRTFLPIRLGAAMFAISAQLFGTHTLVSYVNRNHSQALRLNRAAGLIPEDSSNKSGEVFFRTPIITLLSTPVYRRCIRGLTIYIKKPL